MLVHAVLDRIVAEILVFLFDAFRLVAELDFYPQPASNRLRHSLWNQWSTADDDFAGTIHPVHIGTIRGYSDDTRTTRRTLEARPR